MLLASTLSAELNIPEQIQADFHQTVLNTENNQTLNYSGSVYMKFPNEAKWIYKEPIEKIICLMKNRAWVIEPELEQATLFELDKAVPILKILKQAKEIEKHKYKALYEGVEYIIITDSKDEIKEIKYIDDLGNSVVLTFKELKTKPLDQSILKCTIPEDYDIIDSRY
jgi:outer membrane lipoprotein-sorting protein